LYNLLIIDEVQIQPKILWLFMQVTETSLTRSNRIVQLFI